MNSSSHELDEEDLRSIVSEINKLPMGVTDPQWEHIDPTPCIHALFLQFSQEYFDNALQSVTVEWSKRMTSCCGMTRFSNGACTISLSEKLLKLRPRKDLVETLLHEMIHAYMFLNGSYKNPLENKDGGHGPGFIAHMNRINQIAGCNITVCHAFFEEVDNYRIHVWQCNGPCADMYPFYGKLRRSINRPPGPNDSWWAHHQQLCGGCFIKQPLVNASKPNKAKALVDAHKTNKENGNIGDIRKFFPTVPDSDAKLIAPKKPKLAISNNNDEKFVFATNATNKIDISSHLSIVDLTQGDDESMKDEQLHSRDPASSLDTTKLQTDEKEHVFQSEGVKLGGSVSVTHGAFWDEGKVDRYGRINGRSAARVVSESQGLHRGTLEKIPKKVNSLFDGQGMKPGTSCTVTSEAVEASANVDPYETIDTTKAGHTWDDGLGSATGTLTNIPVDDFSMKQLVKCPICLRAMEERRINGHLDQCLASAICDG